jgi:signal transduction histidine kinase
LSPLERGLTLAAEVAHEVPAWALGDAARLEQVLNNPIGNAIKFTEAGSVTVNVSAEPAAEMVRRFSAGPHRATGPASSLPPRQLHHATVTSLGPTPM